MYLNPQIHDTQDTITIHVRYIWVTRDTHQDTYLEPYLRPRLDTPKPPSRYVSRMYPACILITSEDTAGRGGTQTATNEIIKDPWPPDVVHVAPPRGVAGCATPS